jgi:hypothetical protein
MMTEWLLLAFATIILSSFWHRRPSV